MTTFANGNLPQSGVNQMATLDQLVVYACSAYAEVHGQNRYREREASSLDNGYEPISVASLVPTPEGWMFVGRIAVPVSESWMTPTGGLKLWMYAQERTGGPFPTRFTS